jgi:ribonuclease P protein component
MTNYAEAHISTEQSSPRQDTRIPRTDGDQEWSSGAEASPRQGAQTPHSGALLKQNQTLPQDARLRNSAEFRVVYERGRRFDGRLMTVFVRPNDLGRHRLGITASKKVSRRAVDRNRLKRLLRETFRLSGETLEGLQGKYDWVLNPRRSLLDVKLAAPLKEFREIVERARIAEGSSVANPVAGSVEDGQA